MGASLVLPGRALDGASISELIESEGVTFLLGVPTIWVGVADHLDATGGRLTSVKTIAVGGSAPTAALVSRIEDRLGGQVRQIWGMTETSPLGVINTPLPEHAGEDAAATLQRKLKQGRGLWGVDLRIVDEAGEVLPRDGRSAGQLQVRGPWVSSAYFKQDGAQAFTDDGWFDTGDIATIDAEGYLRLTDRAKDLIKSGGEWISTLDLEEAVCSHPAVAMGRGDRRAAPEVGRTAPAAGDPAPRPDGGPRGAQGPCRRAGGEMVDARRGADRRRAADRPDRQGAEARTAGRPGEGSASDAGLRAAPAPQARREMQASARGRRTKP